MRTVLFGATGYTGRLTAHALFRRDARLVLAGRSRERLESLAAELGGCDIAVADAGDESAVRDLVGPGDVLVTTVGPFSRLGMPAARAAAAAGTTYLDSTGEPAFVRRLVDELDADARQTGATLVPAFGYDYVPGNLAAELALRQAPDATGVRVGYFVKGGGAGPSGGTLASGAGMMIDPAYAWRGGRLVKDRMASRVADFRVGDRTLQAVTLAGSEHLWLPRRHPGLTDVEVYLGWAGRRSRAVQAASALLGVLTLPPGGRSLAHAAAHRLLPGSTGGPGEQARAGVRTLAVAEATGPGGSRLARVVLDGPSPYDLTAELLAWGATRALEAAPKETGVVGPAEVFGYDELESACAAIGLRPVEE